MENNNASRRNFCVALYKTLFFTCEIVRACEATFFCCLITLPLEQIMYLISPFQFKKRKIIWREKVKVETKN